MGWWRITRDGVRGTENQWVFSATLRPVLTQHVALAAQHGRSADTWFWTRRSAGDWSFKRKKKSTSTPRERGLIPMTKYKAEGLTGSFTAFSMIPAWSSFTQTSFLRDYFRLRQQFHSVHNTHNMDLPNYTNAQWKCTSTQSTMFYQTLLAASLPQIVTHWNSIVSKALFPLSGTVR